MIGQCLAAGLAGSVQGADIFVTDGEVAVVENDRCSIVEAINNANANDQSGSIDCVAGSGSDRILLPLNSTFSITSPDPSGRALPAITDNLTIQGNSATITRPATAPPFGIVETQSTVTFNSITLSNGTVNSHADGGGCIDVGSGRLTLRETTLTSCSASQNGGAIRASSGTYIEVSFGSQLIGNTATQDGGAIYSSDGVVRINGTIANNSASSGGGLFVSAGSLRGYATFEGNSASQRGGGMYVQDATSTVRRGDIVGNYAFGAGAGAFFRGGRVTVESCRVRNNDSGNNGGGIALESTTATLSNCQIKENSASDGGAIHFYDSSATLTGSTVSGNTAVGDGGGIYATTGTLTVRDTTIHSNSTRFSGGGIFLQEGAITVLESAISDNFASASGGGLSVSADAGGASAQVEGSTFSGNSAGSNGGAMQISGNVTASLRNNTVGDNSAGGNGGGLFSNEALFTAEHLTFSGNSAGSQGDNLWIDTSRGPIALRNNLIGAGFNAGIDDCFSNGSLAENLNNLIEDGSCAGDAIGLIVKNPLLEPLGENGGPPTFALTPDSPAIDAADESTCIDSDQRGVDRIAATCDIGAFELTDSIIVDETSPGVGALAISGVDGLCSLPEAILNSSGNRQFSTEAGECEPGIEGASDRIVLPRGSTFTLTEPDLIRPVNGLPMFESRTTIQGNGATIWRDSPSTFRLMENDDEGELSLRNLTLTGGASDYYGRGGAIASDGSLIVDEVTIAGNSAFGGGGAIHSGSYRDGRLVITNSTIANNTSSIGGGVYSRSDAHISNSTISGNTATFPSGGPIPISYNTTSGATTNGGIYYLAGNGGAISTGYNGTISVINSTLAFNTAESGNALSIGNALDLRNTLVVDGDMGSTADCILRVPPYQGASTGELIGNVNNLIEDGSCNPRFSGSGQSLLKPLADNGGPTQTHALVAASNPAIDGGDADTCASITYDQRGAPFSRSIDGDDDGDAVCDIGAFESSGAPGDMIFRDGFE